MSRRVSRGAVMVIFPHRRSDRKRRYRPLLTFRQSTGAHFRDVGEVIGAEGMEGQPVLDDPIHFSGG